MIKISIDFVTNKRIDVVWIYGYDDTAMTFTKIPHDFFYTSDSYVFFGASQISVKTPFRDFG